MSGDLRITLWTERRASEKLLLIANYQAFIMLANARARMHVFSEFHHAEGSLLCFGPGRRSVAYDFLVKESPGQMLI